ncbi:TetR family transcriptional regulator [Nonomuraea sp. NPDC004580]|uniref:TetR/AcrR family transcriptional regulator n=1 Tax=Nonomuraea sp. NPDC004580 TaxID=3154552 RepID=UPI0033B7FEB0
MPATPLRKDAARNRRQILQTARAMVDAGATLQLNAVAREADVGVGTVYRHFPTPEALLAALAEERFEAMIAEVRRGVAAPDVRAALHTFLDHALTAYVEDEAFATEALGPAPTTERTRELRDELVGMIRDLLARAVSEGVLRPGLDAPDLLVLLCGVAYAVKNSPYPDDPAVAARYLKALLNGVLTTDAA